MKRKIIYSLGGLTLSLVFLFATVSAHAQDATPTTKTPSLIQELVNKFGLNFNDVKALFDAHKQEKKSQMETNFTTKLDQLVKDGKITDAQKQLILQKRQEIETNRQNWKNLNGQARRDAMQKERTDLENWAKQNNIDLKYVLGHMRGIRGWM
jgi:Skp family chaperone for outer membrane proteins